MSRPTKDIDFLSKIAKSEENLEKIFSEVGAIHVQDGVRFDTSGIIVEEIIEDAGYAGIRLRMIGYLGRRRESILAEKYEAMVKLSFANSRMKDFYDVLLLSSNYTFDGKLLQEAMENTFRRRETVFAENPVVFQEDFLTDSERQRQWSAFLFKNKLEQIPNDFPVVMAQLRESLNPVNEACFRGWEFNKTWNPSKREWVGNDS